jgi:hypothetical protein
VAVEEGVRVVVNVGVKEAVGVPVFVRVGVWESAAIASCASSVRAAWVASAPRSWVSDGTGVRVTVCVAVGRSVRLRAGVEVEGPCVVGGMETGSAVVGPGLFVRVSLRVGEGAGVFVRSFGLVGSEMEVLVGRTAGGTGEGAKI